MAFFELFMMVIMFLVLIAGPVMIVIEELEKRKIIEL